MKANIPSSLICLVLLLCGCGSQPANPSAPMKVALVSQPGEDHDRGEASIVVRPRQDVFKLAEAAHFDVVVANPTGDAITVPYIYDCVIEIDGARYTQFPKPRLVDENGQAITGRIFPAQTELSHGTLTLNGKNFTTVDAKTGKRPLVLAAGKHTLVLIGGPYRSAGVTFTVAE